MIKVTRLNDSVMLINVEKIQSLQATPDTLITFTNQDKIMVKEPIDEVSQRIVEYQRAIGCSFGDHRLDGGEGPGTKNLLTGQTDRRDLYSPARGG